MGLMILRTVASFAALAICCAVPVGNAQAQIPDSCQAVETSNDDVEGTVLYVVCDGAAVGLGRVDEYQLTNLPTLNAAMVVTTFDGAKRAWMLIRGNDGLVLEEVTGSIARMSGRGTGRGIDDMNLDFVSPLAGLEGGASASQIEGVETTSIDVTELVARSRIIGQAAGAEEVDQ